MKKTLSIVLALCLLLSVTAFAAYGEHDHKLMNNADADSHFEECQVCQERFNEEKHTFANGRCSVCGHAGLSNPFVDVAEDAWYHDEIVKAVSTGIINGKSATEFKPDDYLTYAEAIKLAACMNQAYLYGEVTLQPGEPWYKPYADYCEKNDIISKDYSYDSFATRAGYIEIFANALPDEAFEEINKVPNGSILDVNRQASYAVYVYKLYRAGIVTGVDGEHNCNPDAKIIRAEVATIISRMMDEEKRVKFDMPYEEEEPENNLKTEDHDIEIKDKPSIEVSTTPSDAPVIENGEVKYDNQSVVVENANGSETPKYNPTTGEELTISVLTIYKQPKGYEADVYGMKYEASVQVYGGKAPYSYQWYYYTGYRNNTAKIENGDYVKDVTSEALILSIEKENTLLGQQIYCEITDSAGAKVTTDKIKVYGPFSMPVEESLSDSGKNVLTGRVADGILKKGEKVSVIRNGKVIAIGIAEDLQMFGKSLDETIKGDNVGIVFDRKEGARPAGGDIVVKYQPSHVVDTSDIVN